MSTEPAQSLPLQTAPANADAALMARVGQGDEHAFAILMKRHSQALYKIGCRILGDRHEAEDIVQECFVRLWQRAPGWQATGSGLVGWLYRVAVNLCCERHRRLRMLGIDNGYERADDAPLPDAVLEASETHNAVIAALGRLPERYRAALVLCYAEGLTNALAAEAMLLNLKAMESLLFRAKRQLRELLAERDLEAPDLSCQTAIIGEAREA